MSPANSGQRVLVVIPTYNERDNIQSITQRVFDAVDHAHVLVVDDGSPDGTGALVDDLAATNPRLHILHRTAKAGLGAAYIAGFGWGIDAGYDVFVEMDADGSHAPEQLPRLLNALAEADMVLGSRWVLGGEIVDWPKSREFISRGGSLYTRLALGVQIRDVTGGYRAYRREVLEKIDYAAVTSQGYCFQIDMAWRALRAGYRVVEVPITFAERQIGQSKMSGSIVREALLRVTRWGIEYRVAEVRNAVETWRSKRSAG
jgi:dolichol-phosphate mannosyltransferase